MSTTLRAISRWPEENMARFPFTALPQLALQANLYVSKIRLHRSASRLIPRLSGRVLDVGAGSQPYRRYLRPGSEYVAMEVGGARDGHITADALHMPFASAVFDGIVCTEVIEHVTDPAVAVREIGRICKPGARLYLSAPMSWGLHYEPHDYFRFTKYGIESLLGRSGFRVEETIRIGGLFTMVLARLGDAAITFLYRAAFPLKYLVGSGRRVALVSALVFPAIALLDLVAATLDHVLPGTGRDCLAWAVLARKEEGGSDP